MRLSNSEEKFSFPLGQVLQQAGLISAPQLEVALHDQVKFSDLRLGEILALRGWIKPETADFFAEKWQVLLSQPRKPLGFYLKEAALLDEEKVSVIISSQRIGTTKLRFGTLAVIMGWIKPNTRDFFLEHFCGDRATSPFADRCAAPTLILASDQS